MYDFRNGLSKLLGPSTEIENIRHPESEVGTSLQPFRKPDIANQSLNILLASFSRSLYCAFSTVTPTP
jgi:hypothetical protein